MESLLSVSNIMFSIGILSLIFSVYHYFKNPQISMEKKDALLAQKLQYVIDGNENRFKTIQDSFNALLLQSNNHIHTVDVKVDKLCENVSCMGNALIKLSTIIEERIPKK